MSGSDLPTMGIGSHWQDLAVGQRFRTLGRTVTEADLIGFIGVTGMTEEMFIDATCDKGAAASGRLVPAALTYTLIEGLLVQSVLQATGLALLEVQKKVLGPTVVGDTVHGEVEITALRPTSTGNRGIVTTTVDIVNQRGETVIRYHATRMLAGRPDADG